MPSLFPTASDPKLVLELDGRKFILADASRQTNDYAWNNHGLSWSENDMVAVKLIELQAPDAPTNLTASAASATSIRLDWTPPAKNGGSDVTGYKIEVWDAANSEWDVVVADTSSTSTSYTDTGLTTSCTRRTYRVSAINAIGTGTASNTAAAAPHLAPGEPVVPGGHPKLWESTLTVGSSGGVTGYGVTYGSLTSSTFTYDGVTRTITGLRWDSSGLDLLVTPKINDIPNATLHVGSEKFAFADASDSTQVITWTDTSSGCPGDTITVKLTTAAPGAPRNLTAKAASTTQIDLAWEAPTKTGGSSITGYKIEVSTDNGSTWSDLVASNAPTTYSHTALSTGNTRHYRVSAINTDGTGPVSEEASATIAVPGAPGGLKATAGNKQVTLVWNAASDSGSNSITKYRVRHEQGASVPSGTSWTDVTDGADARTHTVKSLTNGSEYTFEVQAVNGVGEGTAGTVKSTPKRPAASLTYRFYVTNYSIKRGSNKVGERKAGGYVGVVRDDDPDTLEGSETVKSDTTFTLTWNGRPTDELHPDNPTSVTITAGQRGARFSLKAAADDDDPKVYNQRVKADVVATLGDLELRDQLVVFDDESLPTVSLSAPATVAEGDAFRVTATLTHRLDVDTSIPIVVHNPSNMTLRGIDGPYTSISIPAGEISGETGDIRKQNDGDEDGWGDLFVGINGINFSQWWPSSKQAKVRVTDDESTDNPERRRYAGWPRLYVGDVNATESGDPGTVTKMKFPVTLYPTSRDTVTVDYRTEDGSAKAGVNYRAKSGTLTFAPREKTKTVEVDVLDDGKGSHLTFRLVLTGPRGGGAEVRTYTVTGRIYDETPTFISYDESARESGNGSEAEMTFIVKLKYGAGNKTYTVDYATRDGSARAGSDYTATSGTLTFAPGERGWQEVKVPILDDTIRDSGETFSLVLSNPTGGAQLHAWKSEPTGTILNDDTEGLAASFPASRFASASHSGVDDRPKVIVAFSAAVASIAADTPSVAVTGATVSSVQAHTEAGLENAWAFVLAPEGDGDVTFTLVADAACASGGICTDGGTVVTQVPASSTIRYSDRKRKAAALTGFTLVDAGANADLMALAEGSTVRLGDLLAPSYGIRAETGQGEAPGSVRFALSGAKTVTRTDDAAPWSLYGDGAGRVNGEALPPGSYTLRATTYADSGGQGEELGSLDVSFTVAAGALGVTTPGPFTVAEGATAVAKLGASQTESGEAASWSIPAGAAGGADGAAFTLTSDGTLSLREAKDFEAPDDADGDGTYAVTVEVSAGAQTATAALLVTLTDVNEAPVAKAAAAPSVVREGVAVTLNGSASTDPDAGDTLSYAWTQTDEGGPRVTLSDASAAQPVFTSPSDLAAETELAFTLRVTDAEGLYTEDAVTVTVSLVSEVSIAAATDYTAEGTDAVFRLTRAGSALNALTVPVSVEETGAMLGSPVPAGATFAAGARETELRVPTAADAVQETDSRVTARLASGSGWQLAPGPTTASLTVLDDDVAPVTSVSAVDVTIWSADMTVVEYGPRSIGAGTADLFSNQMGRAGLRAKRLWYDPSERKLRIGFDAGLDDAESLTLHLGGVSLGFPENSGGDSSFTLENVDISWTDGETVAARVSKPSTEAVSTDATLVSLTVEGATLSPAFDAGVLVYRAVVDAGVETVTLSATATDGGASVAYGPAEDADAALADHQVTVPDVGETLVAVTATAADGTVRRYRVVVALGASETAPSNTVPTGLPAISGTPEVGRVLTASVDGIADVDGLDGVTFAYRWLANDGTDDTEIEGATGTTHEVAPEQAGKTLKVQVTFTDGGGTEEVLTSVAMEAVVDRRPVAATLSVGAGAAETGRFRLRIDFADAVTGLAAADFTAAWVGGAAAAVSDLTEAETGRVWTAWVAAADAGRYTVRLAAGAVQSGERRSLASVLAVDVDAEGNATAVAGPVVTSVSLAPAGDGSRTDGGAVRVTLAFSVAVTVATDGGTPTVGIGLDGSARQASYAGGTGTASLAFSYTEVADDGTVSAVSVTADSLALNGGTIRDAGGRDADLEHPGVGEATEEPETVATTAALTGLKLVHAGTGGEVVLADGDALVLEDPANGSYGLAASVSSAAGVGSVRLALTGAKTVTATDDAAPYSLYGDEDGTVSGAGLPAGSYTLSATAYAEAGGGGAELGTLSVSFRVAASEPVDPDALTASFTGVPAEHGGGRESIRFSFELSFSENPKLSYITLRDHSFTVTGGDVKTAKRKTRGSNQHWTITVEPDGWGDVSLILPGGRACGTEGAICTADDKVLANTAGAVVPGPLALSVADARIDEAPGAVLAFEVTLNRAATGTVTVDYATADGTATAGADYTATSGKLTFDPGETAKTVNVTVLDDEHDDTEETLTLTLSNAAGARIRDGEATGTIVNSDAIPKAWLARFGRTVADHVVDAVAERLTGSPGGGSQVTLGGQRIPLDGFLNRPSPGGTAGSDARETAAADTLAAFADRISGDGAGTGRIDWGILGGEGPAKRPAARTLSDRELLLGSSFVLALGGDGSNGTGTAWAAWGRAAASRFDGEADGLSVDGDVTTFTLGADAARGRWLGGVALAHSTGEGGFRDHPARGSGELESTLTGVHPYLRFEVSERLTAWGILGYGTGDLTLAVDAAGDNPRKTWKTDTSMWMAAGGARGVLLSAADTGGFELAARGDARLVRIRSEEATGADGAGKLAGTEAETSRLRLILEGSHRIAFAGGQTLTPSLEIGLRNDGGDAETGTGVEVGGGIAWSDPALGLTVTAKARGLLTHRDSDYTEWGASGSVKIDPGASGLGLALTLTPAWGADSGGAERLWGLSDARGLAGNDNVERAGRLDAEAGYGFGAFGGRGLMTPFAGLALSEAGNRTWRTGVRWTLGPDLSFGVEGAFREGANDDPAEHEIGFKLTARF